MITSDQSRPPWVRSADEDQAALLAKVQALFGEGTVVKLTAWHKDTIPLPLPQNAASQGPPPTVIAVQCGPQSTFLCALAPNDQASLEKVFLQNPVLHHTLITRWSSGHVVVWFRCTDWLPSDFSTTELIWCSSGLIPVALPGDSFETVIVRKHSIIAIPFEGLKWDGQARQLFRERRLASLYGPVVRRIGPRKKVVNDATACRMFAEAVDLKYDIDAREFSILDRDTKAMMPISQERLAAMIARWLQEMAHQCPGNFPLQEIRLPRIRTMVQGLKLVCGFARTTEREGLLTYVQTRLERRDGAHVTPGEIYSDYFADCRRTGTRVFPECSFRDVLPGMIREKFGLTKVHNIPRPKQDGKITARNGFNGLALKIGSYSDATDAKEFAGGVIQQSPEVLRTAGTNTFEKGSEVNGSTTT